MSTHKKVSQMLNYTKKWIYKFLLIFYKKEYRIRANKRQLSIRPPLWHNSNKTPLFCYKSSLFGAFWGKNSKNSNTLPLKKPQGFIDFRPFNSADKVYLHNNTSNNKVETLCLWSLPVITKIQVVLMQIWWILNHANFPHKCLSISLAYLATNIPKKAKTNHAITIRHPWT